MFYQSLANDNGHESRMAISTQHKMWRKGLKGIKLIQTMSHRARCLDNTYIEKFFNRLKVEISN